MVEIPLTQGKTALIDDADLLLLSGFSWNAILHKNGVWYAHAYAGIINGKQRFVLMHRLIMNAPKGVNVDHFDFDGLNNRRSNLRLATGSQSTAHRRKNATMNGCKPSSRFRGVTLRRTDGTWRASIQSSGRIIRLGSFASEVEAARAYDEAARQHHGEFAMLNFS